MLHRLEVNIDKYRQWKTLALFINLIEFLPVFIEQISSITVVTSFFRKRPILK